MIAAFHIAIVIAADLDDGGSAQVRAADTHEDSSASALPRLCEHVAGALFHTNPLADLRGGTCNGFGIDALALLLEVDEKRG